MTIAQVTHRVIWAPYCGIFAHLHLRKHSLGELNLDSSRNVNLWLISKLVYEEEQGGKDSNRRSMTYSGLIIDVDYIWFHCAES